MLKNASGGLFGIGTAGNAAFWLEIRTSGTPAPSSGYDFAANACQARWTSGSGSLPCPGTPNTPIGYGWPVTNPVLENNTIDSRMGILMVPHNVYNGFVQAAYPAFTVQSGDRFQSTINCEFGSKGCYVIFQLDYQVGNGPLKTLWSFGEKYEGLYYQADIDLSSLAGQNVQFILKVGAAGSPLNDRALWVGPRITRTGGSVPPPAATNTAIPPSTATTQPGGNTPIPSATPSLPPQNTLTPVPTSVSVDPSWSMYQNTTYGYFLRFPPGTTVTSSSVEKVIFNLPFAPNTNLLQKYLQTDVRTNSGSCTNPLGWTASASSTVTMNGIQYLFESGTVVNTYKQNDWRSYSTVRGTNCFSFSFVLYSNTSGAPAPFNRTAESAVFDAILSTIGFTSP
jgi:hypothetical protein